MHENHQLYISADEKKRKKEKKKEDENNGIQIEKFEKFETE